MARLGSIELKLDRALELFTTSFKTLSTQLEKKADKEVVESLSTKLSHVQLEVDELKSSQQHAVDKRLDSYVSELHVEGKTESITLLLSILMKAIALMA